LSQIYEHKLETQAIEKTRKLSTLAQDRENNGIEPQITGHKVSQSIPLMNVEVLTEVKF